MVALLLVALIAPAVNADSTLTATALAPVPGHDGSVAEDINNRGDVVGVSFGSAGVTATRWDKDGNPTALAPLPGHEGSAAAGVNDSGNFVVGISFGPGLETSTLWD